MVILLHAKLDALGDENKQRVCGEGGGRELETEGCVYLSAPERNRMHTFGSITPHEENASQNPADSSLQ
jgi:hypothetical protein